MSADVLTVKTRDLRPGDVMHAPIDFGTRRAWREVADVNLVSGEHEISFVKGEPMLAEPDEEWEVDRTEGSILFTMGGDDEEQVEYRAQIVTLETFERDYYDDALLAGAAFEFAGVQYVLLAPRVAR